MSVRDRLRGLASLVGNIKSPASVAQSTGQSQPQRSLVEGDSLEEPEGSVSGSESGGPLDLSQSGDADRDDTQPTDDSDTPHQYDRQHSTRTTDLRQLDGHESWRGVYDQLEADGWRHE